MRHEVVEVTAADTHELRRAVLRKGMESSDVHFPEDEAVDAFHLAVRDGDALVGIASFSRNPAPGRAAREAWQLRGMAVADERQGAGIGADLINVAIDRLRSQGADVLWCNARDSAQRFYAQLGFLVEGDGFVTKTTRLPHHVMVLDL